MINGGRRTRTDIGWLLERRHGTTTDEIRNAERGTPNAGMPECRNAECRMPNARRRGLGAMISGISMHTSRRSRRLAVALIVIAAAVVPGRPSWLRGDLGATAQPAAKVDFATQIEPILREQCYECHGEKKA